MWRSIVSFFYIKFPNNSLHIVLYFPVTEKSVKITQQNWSDCRLDSYTRYGSACFMHLALPREAAILRTADLHSNTNTPGLTLVRWKSREGVAAAHEMPHASSAKFGTKTSPINPPEKHARQNYGKFRTTAATTPEIWQPGLPLESYRWSSSSPDPSAHQIFLDMFIVKTKPGVAWHRERHSANVTFWTNMIAYTQFEKTSAQERLPLAS